VFEHNYVFPGSKIAPHVNIFPLKTQMLQAKIMLWLSACFCLA